MSIHGRPGWRLIPALGVALLAATLLLPAPIRSAAKKGKAQAKAAPGVVIMPSKQYKDPAWRKKAAKLRPVMLRVQSACTAKFKPAEFRFLTTRDTSVGGIGVWMNPVKFGSTDRYLGIFARVQMPLPANTPAFPDSENGRILTVFDAYGKEIAAIMEKELAKLPDPEIKGGALILVYGKRPVADPEFESDAEGLLMFIPRATLTEFVGLRMKEDLLFAQSDRLPTFRGTEQLKTLRMDVLKP